MAGKSQKRKRRLPGSGSVFFHEGRQVWIGRVIVGRKPDGKPLLLERSGTSIEQLQKKLAAIGPPGSGTTVGEWLDRWLAEMTCRPRTRTIRETDARLYLKPVLGRIPVAALTPVQIEQACVEWGRHIAPNTVRKCVSVLRTALTAAIRARLRTDNPVSSARKPRAIRKKIDPFSTAQTALIIAEAARRRSTYPLALIAATGCRIGEAIALDCEDWDGTSVSISRTQGLDGASGPTKSSQGVRVCRVPLPARASLAAAKGGRTKGPLFVTASGRRTTHHLVRKAWAGREDAPHSNAIRGLLERLDLPYRSIHQLRHTSITNQLALGCAPADVARYHGITVEMVMRVYCHPTGRDSSEGMDRLLESGAKVGAKKRGRASPKKSKRKKR
jgi:integrase